METITIRNLKLDGELVRTHEFYDDDSEIIKKWLELIESEYPSTKEGLLIKVKRETIEDFISEAEVGVAVGSYHLRITYRKLTFVLHWYFGRYHGLTAKDYGDKKVDHDIDIPCGYYSDFIEKIQEF